MYKRAIAFVFLTFNARADGFGNESSDADVIAMSMHYVSQFNGISSFLTVLSFLIGFIYIYKAMFGLPALSDRNNQHVTGTGLFLYAFTGVVLMYIAVSQLIVYESLYGSYGGDFESPFNYSMQAAVSFAGTAEEANEMMIKQFFKMVGALSFMYGANQIPTLDRSHRKYNEASLGKVLTFMISGVMSMAPDKSLELLIEFIPYLKVFSGT